MRRLVVPMVLALIVAGCGGGGSEPNAPPDKTTPNGPRPQSGNADAEPYGALSAAEYRAIVREYRELHPLSQGQDSPADLARGRAACARLRVPRTQLVSLVRGDCNNAISFFVALASLEQLGSDCGNGLQSNTIACARDRYSEMADAIRKTREGATAINDELRRRGITGLCARSIGITGPQVEAYRRAEQAARDAVDAIAAGDSTGLQRANSDLSNALSSGPSDDPLTGIERGCSKAKPQPLPRVPGEGTVKA